MDYRKSRIHIQAEAANHDKIRKPQICIIATKQGIELIKGDRMLQKNAADYSTPSVSKELIDGAKMEWELAKH